MSTRTHENGVFKTFHSGERFRTVAFSSDTCGREAKTEKKNNSNNNFCVSKDLSRNPKNNITEARSGWKKVQGTDENVHPNLVLVLLFVRTEVEGGKGLMKTDTWDRVFNKKENFLLHVVYLTRCFNTTFALAYTMKIDTSGSLDHKGPRQSVCRNLKDLYGNILRFIFKSQ